LVLTVLNQVVRMPLAFPLTLSCCPSGKRSHARQVAGCLGHEKELVDALA
jgi:hypothetical protein